MEILWAIFAVSGTNSLKWIPGMLVLMLRNGPAYLLSGNGCQLSYWLMPPSSQIKHTCFCCFLIASATAGCIKLPNPTAPPIVPSIARREIPCSVLPQA